MIFHGKMLVHQRVPQIIRWRIQQHDFGVPDCRFSRKSCVASKRASAASCSVAGPTLTGKCGASELLKAAKNVG